MDRRIAVVLLLLSFVSGCSNVKRGSDAPQASVNKSTNSDTNLNSRIVTKGDSVESIRLDALLRQQGELLERQRTSILELQQQYQQMQKQLIALTSAGNSAANSAANSTIIKNPTALTAAHQFGLPSVSVPTTQVAAISVLVDASGKQVLGQFEWAWFDLFSDSVNVRIDTGAKFSKLFASDIQIFERDGSNWVRFSLSAPWQNRVEVSERTFEAPLARKVKVKATGATPVMHRPVIKLTMKVGAIVEDIEFVLHQRSSTNEGFSALLGRSFVRDLAVVDVSLQHTQKKFIRAVGP